LCNELLKSNCIVFACDLNKNALEKSFALYLSNPNLKLFEMDVTKPESIQKGVEHVKSELKDGKLFGSMS
jgi:NADP-dependent 3-hydroxy acid dehydrogenase YdfG